MKILHILNSDQFSGAENVVCQIIAMFSENKDVKMVYCSREGRIRQALMERDVEFVPIHSLTISEVKRVIKEQRPDIIHAHDMRASFVAALSCKKIPLISHIHNNAFDSRGLSTKSIAYIVAACRAKHIFWVSQSAFAGYCFGKFFSRKSSVLCNIIDIEKLYEKMRCDESNYEYDVVYIGRLTTPKNPERLMHICAKLVEKRPSIRIAVVGTGELETETKNTRAALKLEKNVDMLGFQSNPLKILHDSKVMVMTSLWEGTPMVALEAMALGVPIVSTPTDGLKDLIEDGKNGFLSDDDDILANRIIEVVANDELQSNMSKNAMQKSRKINNVEYYVQTLMRQYQ